MIPITRCTSRYEADLAGSVSLFQVQWDRCDQQNAKLKEYLVKGHHLYSGT
jgi:hypothetical protein